MDEDRCTHLDTVAKEDVVVNTLLALYIITTLLWEISQSQMAMP